MSRKLIKRKKVDNIQGTIHKEVNNDYIIEIIKGTQTVFYGTYNKFEYTYSEVKNILDDKLEELKEYE